LRVTVGQKKLVQQNVELKDRKSGETRIYHLRDIVAEIKKIIAESLNPPGHHPPET